MTTITLFSEHGLFHTKVILKSGELSPRHLHKQTHETYCIIQGEGTIMLDGKNLPVKQGDFVSIPVHTPHHIINEGLLPLEILSTKNNSDPKDTFAC
jgi:mannose-6-phosphate isomerase-like protein (cupin superfamily)